MTSRLLSEFKQKIASLKLIPGSGGAFELTGNGELLYSKLQTGQFPEEQAMVDLVQSKLTKK